MHDCLGNPAILQIIQSHLLINYEAATGPSTLLQLYYFAADIRALFYHIVVANKTDIKTKLNARSKYIYN